MPSARDATLKLHYAAEEELADALLPARGAAATISMSAQSAGQHLRVAICMRRALKRLMAAISRRHSTRPPEAMESAILAAASGRYQHRASAASHAASMMHYAKRFAAETRWPVVSIAARPDAPASRCRMARQDVRSGRCASIRAAPPCHKIAASACMRLLKRGYRSDGD